MAPGSRRSGRVGCPANVAIAAGSVVAVTFCSAWVQNLDFAPGFAVRATVAGDNAHNVDIAAGTAGRATFCGL